MIRIIWNALLLAIIAIVAAWLSNNSGAIEIEWIGYQVQTSVAVVIALVVFCYAIFYVFLAKPILLLKQKMAFVLGADKRADKIAQSKIEKETNKTALIGSAFVALAAGNLDEADRLAKKLAKSFDKNNTQFLIFKAQLAETKNETQSAIALYEELEKNPETSLLGIRGQIRLYRHIGHLVQALELCSKVLNEKVCPKWVLSEAFELQIKEKKWADAIVTLDKALKQELFDKLTARRLKASVLLEQAKEAEDKQTQESFIRQAYATDETFVRAAVQMADVYVQTGDIKKAKRLLQKLWKLSPSWDVYQLYLDLSAEKTTIETVREIEGMIAENPKASLNDLVLADVSLKATLWGQAKTSIEKYLVKNPVSKRALIIATEIATYHKDTKKADEYSQRATQAPVERPYFCAVCLTSFDQDHTTCPVCHTLGSLHIPE